MTMNEYAPERRVIESNDGDIEVFVRGDGPSVFLLPSLGRGAEDFDDLASRIAHAGYRSLCLQPRGIGGSTAPLDGLTMADLANDVKNVVEAFASNPTTIVGHAFGNRVARMTATLYPHLVESVVLLACGGVLQPSEELNESLHKVFDIEASDGEHLNYVRQVFFAPGNDASVWFDGWHGVVAYFQGQATKAEDVRRWWGAGTALIHIVQPVEDVIAVPKNGQLILEEFSDRASMDLIPNAGHALLPEQPAAVAKSVIKWLARRNP